MTYEQRPYIQLTLAVKNRSPTDVSHWAPLCSKLQCSQALVVACMQGDVKCLKELIPHANEYMRALWAAMDKKHMGCIKLLLPLTHVKIDHPDFAQQEEDKTYCLLEHAVKKNMFNCIDLLLPYTDLDDRNQCLALAIILNQPKCIEKLLFKADFAAATKILSKKRSPPRRQWQSVLDHYTNVYITAQLDLEIKQSKNVQRKM